MINKFDEVNEGKGFFRCTLGYFRGCKLAYAGYFTPYTASLILKVKEKSETLNDKTVAHNFYKHKFLPCKYLRKFAFDTMISENLNVPESVADSIEGRTPKKIGARHYSRLLTQADDHYPKFGNYISELRKKAGRLST